MRRKKAGSHPSPLPHCGRTALPVLYFREWFSPPTPLPIVLYTIESNYIDPACFVYLGSYD